MSDARNWARAGRYPGPTPPEKSSEDEWPEPVVWLVEEKYRREGNVLVRRHDTSKADAYGIRRSILGSNHRPWDVDNMIDAINVRFAKAYNPRTDSILLIGSPVACSLVFAIASSKAKSKGGGIVQLLYYHKRSDDYRVIRVNAGRFATFPHLGVFPD